MEERIPVPLFFRRRLEVRDGDTPEVLQRRVMEEAEWVIMPRAIDLIANDKLVIENGIVRMKAAGTAEESAGEGTLMKRSYNWKRRKRTCDCMEGVEESPGGRNLLCSGQCRN